MGWSYGTIGDKEIGYSVEDVCNEAECDESINRGLSYACGGEHGSGEFDCDGYFCSVHLMWSEDAEAFVCRACLDYQQQLT